MNDLGIEDLSARRFVELRIHGVDIEYARRAIAKYGDDLTARDLVDMRIHGKRVD